MARGEGKTDLEKLAAYVQLVMQEALRDPTVTVTVIPENEREPRGAKLRADLGADTRIDYAQRYKGSDSQHLNGVFAELFETKSPVEINGAYNIWAPFPSRKDIEKEVGERGRHTQPIDVGNPTLALGVAMKRDAERFARSQQSEIAL